MDIVSKNQHGFRPGLGTVGAIKELLDKIRSAKRNSLHALVVTLDIKNAFNAAWHPSIVRALRQARCPHSLRKVIEDFLANRTVTSRGVMIEMERGCPQGSSLGPTLWLLLMESWFATMEQELGDMDFHQAFADDQVIVLAGTNARELEVKWKRVWIACSNWATENKLEYNIEKTEIMFVPWKRLVREPKPKIAEKAIEMKTHIKYLGVVLDRTGSWVQHARYIRGKVMSMAQRACVLAGKTWGIGDRMRERVYDQVVVPMLTYGAEVWGEKHTHSKVVRNLNAAQRPFLLTICRAFRTAPTNALQVLAGKAPLHLVSAGKRFMAEEQAKGIWEKKVSEKRRVRPEERQIYIDRVFSAGDETTLRDTIYSDASAKDNAVGVAIVRVVNGAVVDEDRHRLSEWITISRAEQVGVMLACEKARESAGAGEIVEVVSDSLSAVRALRQFKTRDVMVDSMQRQLISAWRENKGIHVRYVPRDKSAGLKLADAAARKAREIPQESLSIRRNRRTVVDMTRSWVLRHWQAEWDQGRTGRSVWAIYPTVKFQNRGLSPKAIQLVTGHGYLEGYYRRFNLREGNGICACGRDQETGFHVLWDCELLERRLARTEFLSNVGETGEEWRKRDEKGTLSTEINKLAEKVIVQHQQFPDT